MSTMSGGNGGGGGGGGGGSSVAWSYPPGAGGGGCGGPGGYDPQADRIKALERAIREALATLPIGMRFGTSISSGPGDAPPVNWSGGERPIPGVEEARSILRRAIGE